MSIFQRVGNSQSLVNPLKKSEPLEFKKVDIENETEKCSLEQMMDFCQSKLKGESPLISRTFINLENSTDFGGISVMQWNILSQGKDSINNYYSRSPL